ncbi:hypothetical protein SL054_001283 [Flavobacterium psychrophilum]|uniref:hypothetical protein n=1 Tax=Flavobacterium psychrophilum TaxID=96345 RepID=UPI001C8F8339|nr:hypothetical protein [Flavobacterium psychrophilum]EKT3972895.1 hypothetical protein [Flavobacterium psychrophilum]EKT4499574.1 hypothetical protein [Flavobacterium psychrophilum]EKT4519238.1 hypothetical protein [Flavobacterium psychrophilum]EKT4535622.1 hypothetical protein [Flavobacterium psychrophilum]EKT4569974.1 hypothetical protein [Flavobacterium psychrophilum]
MINIVKENENAEIGFPTLDRYKEVYPLVLSNYLREYKDNTEKRFIELQIEHYKTYCDDFLNNPKYSFNKFNLERFYTSRLLVIEYLELKLKAFENYYEKDGDVNLSMNLEAKELFKWLIDSYRINQRKSIKFINIYYFLKEDDNKSIYVFDINHEEYKLLIDELYGIKISKMSKTDKYLNTDIHILRSKEMEFRKKRS